MAISVFFVATEAQLDALFPGWVPPLPTPVWKTRPNPFSGEPLRSLAYEPDSPPKALGRPSMLDDRWGPAVASTRPTTDLDLERDCPSGLRALPHFCAWDLHELGELLAYARTLLGDEARCPPARLGPEHDVMDAPDIAQGGWPIVDCLSADATHALAASRDDALLDLALRIRFREGEHCSEDDVAEAIENVSEIILPLRALARTAMAQRARLCSWSAFALGCLGLGPRASCGPFFPGDDRDVGVNPGDPG